MDKDERVILASYFLVFILGIAVGALCVASHYKSEVHPHLVSDSKGGETS